MPTKKSHYTDKLRPCKEFALWVIEDQNGKEYYFCDHHMALFMLEDYADVHIANKRSPFPAKCASVLFELDK